MDKRVHFTSFNARLSKLAAHILIGWVLIFVPVVSSANMGAKCAGVLLIHASGAYDSTSKKVDLLQSIREHGLDPVEFSFETRISTDNSKLSLLVFYQGIQAGVIALMKSTDHKTLQPYFETHIQIMEQFQKRRLGPLMYVLAAKAVHDQFHLPARGNFAGTFSQTPNATAVWERFFSQGLARIETPPPHTRYEFIPSALEDRINSDIWALYESRNTVVSMEPKVYSPEEIEAIQKQYDSIFGK